MRSDAQTAPRSHPGEHPDHLELFAFAAVVLCKICNAHRRAGTICDGINLVGLGSMNELPFEDLLRTEDGEAPCVSIYMPTHRAGRETRQGPIMLANLLREARAQGAAQGMPSEAIQAVLVRAGRLLDADAQAASFWQHQQDGLAILLTQETASYARLPCSFEPVVVVGTRLYRKPLLPLRGDVPFTLLAFSQNRVRLFRGSRWDLQQPARNDLPTSMAEALSMDDPEKSLQHHGYSTPSGSQSVFHGQGIGTNDERHKDDLERFFRKLDAALLDSAVDRERPLVLAAVDYMTTMYRSVSKHPDILQSTVAGNPDELTQRELHNAAWQCVQPRLRKRHQEAVRNLRAQLGSGNASDELTTIVRGAHNGRVEDLFVHLGIERFGAQADGTSNPAVDVDRKPGDVDLLDVAADATLRAGGNVHVLRETDDVKVPDGLAATFRY